MEDGKKRGVQPLIYGALGVPEGPFIYFYFHFFKSSMQIPLRRKCPLTLKKSRMWLSLRFSSMKHLQSRGLPNDRWRLKISYSSVPSGARVHYLSLKSEGKLSIVR